MIEKDRLKEIEKRRDRLRKFWYQLWMEGEGIHTYFFAKVIDDINILLEEYKKNEEDNMGGKIQQS